MSNRYNIYFKFNGHYHTKKVEVVGDFNNWKAGCLSLEDDDGDNVWWGHTRLASGKYQYKFLVDGAEYHLDQNNIEKIQNDGMENSLLLVGEAQLDGDFVHNPNMIDFFSENCFYVRGKLNHRLFSGARLIVVVDDYINSVTGYELYRDEVYSFMLFKLKNGCAPHKLLYYFEVDNISGGHSYFGKDGLIDSEWQVENFFHERNCDNIFTTPDWVKDAVFYQIFPERFANGNPRLNPPEVSHPTKPPTADTFYGGDLEGVIQKVDYLKELGINSVYFNPIFDAPSTHKYDTTDYRTVSPHFGGNKVYDKMAQIFKKNDIRFILDGVFNHTGTQFKAFKDIEKNGEKSEYLNWYRVNKFPLREDDGRANYECWWNFASLPELNVEGNPEVEKYLLDVAKEWIEKGAYGWRLDVPNEIDHPFWKKFRDVVKKTDPEAYILGEIWGDGNPWLKGDEFDGVMNYQFRSACIEYFALRKISAEEFVKQIGRQIFSYPMQSNFAAFNLLSSHDTARFFTVCGKESTRAQLAAAFQFTTLGVPSIYYGEEVGMEGDKDPDNRRFMKWDREDWNMPLYETYQTLIALRKEYEVLRQGDIRFVFAKGQSFGFERFIKDDRLLILFNNSDDNINLDVTRYWGNGDFLDISKNYPLKRKRAYTLYGNDYAILKKTKDR